MNHLRFFAAGGGVATSNGGGHDWSLIYADWKIPA
jgi:hypothetical protein